MDTFSFYYCCGDNFAKKFKKLCLLLKKSKREIIKGEDEKRKEEDIIKSRSCSFCYSHYKRFRMTITHQLK